MRLLLEETMLAGPFTLPCGLTLENRIAKASMTERLAHADGNPSPALLRLYGRFAAGGAGLLLTGNVAIDPSHLEAYGNAVLEREEQLPAFRAWAASGAETPIIVQLNHPGRQAPRTLLQRPVSASDVGLRGAFGFFARPRALGAPEIEQIIERFVHSAVLAERAGFAGVQIHAAHGYLISQFLSPNVNRRTDVWGGSLENRARMLLEIVDRTRQRVSPRFAVGVKLNAGDFVKGGFEPHEAEQVMRWLDQRALDFIEISGGTFERPASFGRGLRDSTRAREAYFVELAQKARAVTAIPLMVTGGFRSGAAMRAALESRACDLIGLARPLAVEPDLPRQLLADPQARARAVALSLPPGPMADLAELYWYRQQLAQLAGDAAAGGSALGIMLRHILHDVRLALSHMTERRQRLGAGGAQQRGV